MRFSSWENLLCLQWHACTTTCTPLIPTSHLTHQAYTLGCMPCRAHQPSLGGRQTVIPTWSPILVICLAGRLCQCDRQTIYKLARSSRWKRKQEIDTAQEKYPSAGSIIMNKQLSLSLVAGTLHSSRNQLLTSLPYPTVNSVLSNHLLHPN